MTVLKEALSRLFADLTNEQQKEFVNVIMHIIRRLIEYPGVPKFRILRKDNEAFKNKILDFEGSSNVLNAIGFVEEDNKWYFPVTNDSELRTRLREIENIFEIECGNIYKEPTSKEERRTNVYSNCPKEFSREVVVMPEVINQNSSPSVGLQLEGLSKRRLEKEKLEILNEPENIVKLIQELPDRWIIQIKGAEDTLYSNETFNIQFKFTDKYPIESPEVVFLGVPPVHPHVYSNGHICLSILYDHWSPVLSVNAVCLSIISMLSSCKKKKKPIDDLFYCSAVSQVSPKNMKWMFHDDSI